MNALLLAYKPPFISSNGFLTQIKRSYNTSKAGFSGTLDPFAQGSLLIATGAYTKLLPFIKTEPKVYEATLWLGAKSLSLDTENITHIDSTPPLDSSFVREVVEGFVGEIAYTPPAFSAKKIQGKRAYTLARSGQSIELAPTTMHSYTMEFLCYVHPFISFRACVSKGSYIRSLGSLIAQKLGSFGTLSALKRVSEGDLVAQRGKIIELDPLKTLPYPTLPINLRYKEHFYHGRKLTRNDLDSSVQARVDLDKNPRYIVQFDEFFSIIQLYRDGSISYLLNRMDYAHTLQKAR
ncbi:tRNA pseudouridine(55) synthase TruB [Helicobacter canis]|uniref:tRNA pseudouridine(55) synthase TruB n=1 Tax=Helicobacter canis TaxID=29419 RepID=UPI0026E9A9FA|nr:tRNA pseudouridine(55) synthase TruB [Helicobacter canis]